MQCLGFFGGLPCMGVAPDKDAPLTSQAAGADAEAGQGGAPRETEMAGPQSSDKAAAIGVRAVPGAPPSSSGNTNP